MVERSAVSWVGCWLVLLSCVTGTTAPVTSYQLEHTFSLHVVFYRTKYLPPYSVTPICDAIEQNPGNKLLNVLPSSLAVVVVLFPRHPNVVRHVSVYSLFRTPSWAYLMNAGFEEMFFGIFLLKYFCIALTEYKNGSQNGMPSKRKI